MENLVCLLDEFFGRWLVAAAVDVRVEALELVHGDLVAGRDHVADVAGPDLVPWPLVMAKPRSEPNPPIQRGWQEEADSLSGC